MIELIVLRAERNERFNLDKIATAICKALGSPSLGDGSLFACNDEAESMSAMFDKQLKTFKAAEEDSRRVLSSRVTICFNVKIHELENEIEKRFEYSDQPQHDQPRRDCEVCERTYSQPRTENRHGGVRGHGKAAVRSALLAFGETGGGTGFCRGASGRKGSSARGRAGTHQGCYAPISCDANTASSSGGILCRTRWHDSDRPNEWSVRIRGNSIIFKERRAAA